MMLNLCSVVLQMVEFHSESCFRINNVTYLLQVQYEERTGEVRTRSPVVTDTDKKTNKHSTLAQPETSFCLPYTPTDLKNNLSLHSTFQLCCFCSRNFLFPLQFLLAYIT